MFIINYYIINLFLFQLFILSLFYLIIVLGSLGFFDSHLNEELSKNIRFSKNLPRNNYYYPRALYLKIPGRLYNSYYFSLSINDILFKNIISQNRGRISYIDFPFYEREIDLGKVFTINFFLLKEHDLQRKSKLNFDDYYMYFYERDDNLIDNFELKKYNYIEFCYKQNFERSRKLKKGSIIIKRRIKKYLNRNCLKDLNNFKLFKSFRQFYSVYLLKKNLLKINFKHKQKFCYKSIVK